MVFFERLDRSSEPLYVSGARPKSTHTQFKWPHKKSKESEALQYNYLRLAMNIIQQHPLISITIVS